MNRLFKFLFTSLVLSAISCSVDYSLLNNRQCDSEGRCVAGYVCDRATMTCVREGSMPGNDAGTLPDIIRDEISILDTEMPDSEEDAGCRPTNNGIEICDGIDNNCDGRTDENYVCGSCTLTNSITEQCNESTKCDKCFIVNGEKYRCVSVDGLDFNWRKESELICDSSKSIKAIKCENICQLCDGNIFSNPFIIQNESCDGKDNNCDGKIDEGDICPTNNICVGGKCIERPCQKKEDCPPEKVCKENKCQSCTEVVDDSLCGSGKICINGACIDGDCHQNTDCSGGICVSNKCCTGCCAKKKDCPAELVCKKGLNEQIGNCESCTDIIDDLLCGFGYICEGNKCIKGECHPSIGCLPGKICVNYNCCNPGPTCCNKDGDCKSNMTCTQNHTCDCKPLFGDCNNKYDDGCEKDLSSDINNCGVCNQKCVFPNADPQCVNGKCLIKNCKPNFKDCNQKPEDGCEIDISKDILNCGDCNSPCSADNATVKCEQSKCVISACNLGFADCDGNYNNGCEINTNTDSKNCGDCGNKCKPNEICKNGQCN